MAETHARPEEVAVALRLSVGLFLRRARQIPLEGDLSLSESAALVRLDRGGPATAAALARLEQISPQSMGATLAGLGARGLGGRRRGPDDGRRIILSISRAGMRVLNNRRAARTTALARALSAGFTQDELDRLMAATPLLERLAHAI